MNLYVSRMKIYRSVRRALNPNRRQGKRRIARIKSFMKREFMSDRDMYHYLGLELHFKFDSVVFLTKIARGGSPVVTEIGGGRGNAIKQLTDETRKCGINIVAHNIALPNDALRVAFPKSDLILSQWALGYVGHPDFMTRKIADTLKPGGVALLHFNSRGALQQFDSYGYEKKVKSPFLDRLVSRREKLENCKVVAHKLKENVESGLYQFLEGDYFIFIRKLASSKK